MWKRDEAVKPANSGQPVAAPQPSAPVSTGIPGSRPEASKLMERDIVNIGKSVVIKGELNGSEDLTVEGHVEGTIQLKDHVLTIGPNGKIKAQVFAKSVIVLGEVTGNVTASDKVDIRDNGSVDGDIISPRVAIAEGAHFRGRSGRRAEARRPAGGRQGAGTATGYASASGRVRAGIRDRPNPFCTRSGPPRSSRHA